MIIYLRATKPDNEILIIKIISNLQLLQIYDEMQVGI